MSPLPAIDLDIQRIEDAYCKFKQAQGQEPAPDLVEWNYFLTGQTVRIGGKLQRFVVVDHQLLRNGLRGYLGAVIRLGMANVLAPGKPPAEGWYVQSKAKDGSTRWTWLGSTVEAVVATYNFLAA